MQIVLVIDENTNYDAISKYRILLTESLKFWDRFQGSNLDINQRNNLYGLLQWKKPGFGWGRLTMFLNYLCFVLTYASYDEDLQMKKNKVTGGTKVDDTVLEVPSEPDGTWLIHIFFALGKDFKDLDEWMEQGYKYLARGQFPMRLRDEPFYFGRVRDKVRYFKERVQAGNITISENDLNWNILEYIIYIWYQRGYFQKMDKVLDKEGMNDWIRNKKIIQRKISEIIEKWERAENSKTARMRDLLKSGEKP